MSRIGQLIDKLVVARVWGKGRMGVIDNGVGISFRLNENILKLHDSDNTKTVWTNLYIVHSKWALYMAYNLCFKAVIKK